MGIASYFLLPFPLTTFWEVRTIYYATIAAFQDRTGAVNVTQFSLYSVHLSWVTFCEGSFAPFLKSFLRSIPFVTNSCFFSIKRPPCFVIKLEQGKLLAHNC